MINYLILCRSLTYAQRSAAVLERAGLAARVLRCPKAISTEGCSHCVRISHHVLERALDLLLGNDLTPKRIFSADGTGNFEEVEWR